MGVIQKPLHIPELDIKPEPLGAIGLSDNMQQTLSLLTAFWRNKRVLVKATPSGILSVGSPQLQDVIHITGVGANYNYQGDNVQCSEILVMGHPDNAGTIYLHPHGTATTSNGWPLVAKDVLGFGLTNLNMLHLLITTDGEKAIIAYTI